MKVIDYPEVLSEVSKSSLLSHLEQIAKWVRLSGSEEEARAFDYIKSKLIEYGYKVEEYRFEALIGYPKSARLDVLSPESAVFNGITASLAPPTPKEGVLAEVVYVGRGDKYDQDVRGKIVVIDGLFNPRLAKLAEDNGALGEVFINDDYLHEGIVSTVWGVPTPETVKLLPKAPCLAITAQQGDKLLDLIRKGGVKARLTTDSWIGWKKIPLLTGEIKGNVEDEFVLFSGHVDSWHYGAMDNGSANSAMLEVARILGRHRELLRRGLRLAFWSGHSHGRYAGSAWYADEFWDDLYERCIAHVNIDSVGGKGATLFSAAYVMSEAKDFASKIVEHMVGERLNGVRFSRAGDQSFWGIGITSIFMSLSEQPLKALEGKKAPSFLLAPHSGGLGWWWHTAEDTIDKIDPEFLVRDTRVYLLLLLNLCTTPILPFDYRATLDEIGKSLSEAHKLAAEHLDLASLVKRADSVQRLLEEFYRNLSSVNVSDDKVVKEVNKCIKRIGRLLVPINYSKVGPFDHDLAVPLPPLPILDDVKSLAKMPKGSVEAHLLSTKLKRESNRIAYAFIEVEREVNSALERVGGKGV